MTMLRNETLNDYKKNNKEVYEKFTKAMYLSKGKVNCSFALDIAKCKNSTVDDIIRLVDENVSEDHCYARPYSQNNNFPHKKFKLEDRLKKFYERSFEYRNSDTYLYRALERLIGKNENAMKILELNDDKSRDARYDVRVTEDGAQDSSKLGKDPEFWKKWGTRILAPVKQQTWYGYTDLPMILSMFNKMGKSLREIVLEDEDLLRAFNEIKHIDRKVGYLSSTYSHDKPTDEEWKVFQTGSVVKSMDILAHIPDDLRKEWEELFTKEGCCVTKERFPLHTVHQMAKHNLRSWNRLTAMYLIDDAYAAMKYIGIGLMWMGPVDDSYLHRDKSMHKCTDLLKRISSSTTKFMRDIKKGADPRDARELVIEELTESLKRYNNGDDNSYRFFVRDDAKDEYPDLMPAKKNNKKSVKVEDLNNKGE